jgi:hypothetical protein
MARKLTASEKKVLTAAQAQIGKLKTQLAKNETALATMQQGPMPDPVTGVFPLTGPSWSEVEEDKYYTVKVGNTGKTQAQLDAAKNAAEVAASTGGTIDPKTGKIIPKKNVVVGSGSGNNTDITLISTEKDEYGNVIGFYSDGSSKVLVASGNKYKSTVDVDAYSILENTFKDYGLEELVPDIKRFMEEGLGSNQAAVELKKTKAYTTRFSGNETRRAAGLNVMSEAAYLELENSYSETLRAYGLQGYFGTDRKMAQSKMGELIGNDIAAPEFKERIDTVAMRVNNADPNVRATLKAFYNIQDTDLVKYFLNPKENLPRLQEKVTAAEIGNEALKQNLITSVTSAESFAKLGITKEQAREGYQDIAEVLPTGTKLGQIYDEEGINYNQGTAEQEVFGKLESAKRKRIRLAEKEIAAFSGSSGMNRGALGSSNSGKF